MLCSNPISLGETTVGCGQCMPCRINRKRAWTARVLLEYMMYPCSIFVTLTYDDETCPVSEHGLGTLRPEDLNRFLGRFRRLHRHIGPIRYFAVGEYGDKTWRPHYHAVLFGAGPEAEPMVSHAWEMEETEKNPKVSGFTMCGLMNPDRAAYVCGYVTKKLTKYGTDGLNGRYPEFTRTSRMGRAGGIGGPAIPWLASTMRGKRGRLALARHGDVWRDVRITGKVYPLSYYMRKKLRAELGLSDDPFERAEQLGRIDLDTGEIKEAEPLPDYYGPWHDATRYRLPMVRHAEKEERRLSLPEAKKRADKVERRYSRTSPATRGV